MSDYLPRRINNKKKRTSNKMAKRKIALTVLAAYSGCSTGPVDKRSPRTTTPSSALAPRLSAARTRPRLCAQERDTIGVRRPPNTWKTREKHNEKPCVNPFLFFFIYGFYCFLRHLVCLDGQSYTENIIVRDVVELRRKKKGLLLKKRKKKRTFKTTKLVVH